MKTLKTIACDEFYKDKDMNCSESILSGANNYYDLGFSQDMIHVSSGFGGGMGIGSVCGALTASVMILGYLFTTERAHEGTLSKEIVSQFLESFEKEYGSIICTDLKLAMYTEENGCQQVVQKAAALLEKIVMEKQVLLKKPIIIP